jgi:hypothetical protein
LIFLLVAVAMAGIRLWRNLRRKNARRLVDNTPPSQLSEGQKEDAIAEKLRQARDAVNESPVPADEKERIGQEVDALEEKFTAQSLEIDAFGTISSGKSSLLTRSRRPTCFRPTSRRHDHVA